MKFKRGLAIEYVMLSMALVAGLVSALLISASYTSQKAKSQQDYIERKAFLDESAQTYIMQVTEHNLTASALETAFNDNEYGYVFHVESTTLYATKNRAVVLFVAFERDGSDYKLVAYRYALP